MRSARGPAWAAAALAFAYAAVSAYWTAGGTALLDTVGGGLERLARGGGAAGVVLGLVTVLAKLAGGVLALALVRPFGARVPALLLARTALAVGVALALYGAAQMLLGGLALTGLLGEPADPRALRWHVLLWDPWFLLWGLLLLIAVRRRRRPAGAPVQG
ncbi:DUF3995 domain-containing protein [Geodermatophilus sp. URMC 64]